MSEKQDLEKEEVVEKKDTDLAPEHDHTKTYAITLAILFVVTVIEYLVGFMDVSTVKIVLLVILSMIKATFIVAVFMHVKYNKDWKVIVGFGIIIPLILTFYLFIMIYSDYGIQVIN